MALFTEHFAASESNFRLALTYQKMNEGGREILDRLMQKLVKMQNRPTVTMLTEMKEDAENS